MEEASYGYPQAREEKEKGYGQEAGPETEGNQGQEKNCQTTKEKNG